MSLGTFGRQCARRGSALIAGLATVTVVGALSMAYLQISLNKSREQQGSVDAKRAFYIAEAGLSEAALGLMCGKSGNVGTLDTPARFGDGVFWVEAKDKGTQYVQLTSTGLCGSGRAALSIVVKKTRASIGSQGLFAQQGVQIGAGCVVDSYDSRQGTYASQAPNLLDILNPPVGAKVGSNADIALAGASARAVGAAVYGDARPGPNGALVRGVGSTVTGATAPNPTPIPFPNIPIPRIAQETSLALATTGSVHKLPTGSTGYQELLLKGGAQVRLNGPAVLLVDRLEIAESARLTIDTTTGPVKIVVREQLKLASGTNIEFVDDDPTRCALLVDGDDVTDLDGDGAADPAVTLGATSQFFGMFYAPKAALNLPSVFEVYGSFAGRSITLASSARVHFDKAIAEMDGAEGELPEMVCWRRVELPPVPIVKQGRDPLKFLENLGVTPPKARDAHFDLGIDLPTAHLGL